MMVIDNKYEIGQIVYPVTDREQSARMVYSVRVFQSSFLYELACGTSTSTHYDFEISKEKDLSYALS